jgi:2-polyprenyl-3-methyl-5-hydroxy-6-metoxy-1,4-benzoquinol methylase
MIISRKTKSLKLIAREWDAIAAVREEQVTSGRDHSANFVLAPAILNELSKVRTLVDIGCGTGWLTERAAEHADITVGIDPSEESIAIGRKHHDAVGVTYYAESIEAYALRGAKFDLAISNMAASSAPDLHAFFSASREILKKDAFFIFTIPHPFFWPLYRGYASHPDFDYQKSFAVEGEFKIQNEASDVLTTHFHHPLATYVDDLSHAGFRIESTKELTGRSFPLPRFMLIKSRAL